METTLTIRSKFRVHPATFVLAASMFMTGACGLVAEYVLCTVATYILGNSIEQFSVVIAVMMVMMGIGGWLQKFMSDQKLIEKFIYIEISLAVLSGFAPMAIYTGYAFLPNHFLLIHYVFVMAIGLLIGFEIPVVMRINELYSDSLKSNVACVSFADYTGAFVGALVWAYIFIRMFPITEIGFMVGGLNLGVAVLTLSYFLFKGKVKNRKFTLVIILLAFAALFYGYYNNRGWNVKLQQYLYEDKILFSKTTMYQHIVLTENRQINDKRLYINGNLQLSSLDEAIYHEQLVHPVMNLVPDYSHVLILGGGDGMALREVLKYDVKTVTLVDLDREMTRLFSTNPELTKLNNNAFRDARVRVLEPKGITLEGWKPIYMETGKEDAEQREIVEEIALVQIFNLDADKFLTEVRGKWNVIIVDLPDPSCIELTKLYSQEFYYKLRNNLTEHGMIVIQSTSPYHAKEAYLCIDRTVKAAGFSTLLYHDNVPSFGDWGWIMAWKPSLAREVIEEKIAELDFPVQTAYLTPDVFRKARVFGKGWLHTDSKRVNTLMHPVLLEEYVYAGWLVE